jgi:hypothetical protein
MLKNSNATIKKNHSERKIAPNTIIKLMLVLIVTDTKLSYKLNLLIATLLSKRASRPTF